MRAAALAIKGGVRERRRGGRPQLRPQASEEMMELRVQRLSMARTSAWYCSLLARGTGGASGQRRRGMVELIQAPSPCRSRDLDRRSEKESEEKKRQQNLQRFTKQKKKGRMRWDFSRFFF
ncbi:hypothetical protein EJB05_34990, partial [Eragrostis curvula]